MASDLHITAKEFIQEILNKNDDFMEMLADEYESYSEGKFTRDDLLNEVVKIVR